MAELTWLCIIVSIGLNSGYENLSRRTETILTQSSTYNINNASLANDGVNKTQEKYCAHTAPNDTIAWFQVDLRKNYSINNVTIYYRREGDGDNDWKQHRFRQFYLDVSDSAATETTTTQRIRCYTDNTTAPDLPENIIDISCNQTARYVIVETKYDSPNDTNIGPILEICEIEVHGCEVGCLNRVCSENGSCTQGCNAGLYGNVCDQACNARCKYGACNQQSGSCSGGCIQNWTGDQCDRCNATHYNSDCSRECSDNCIKKTCNNITGSCTLGCNTGFYGGSCIEVCGAGCAADCDRYNGSCACQKGWQGDTCSSI